MIVAEQRLEKNPTPGTCCLCGTKVKAQRGVIVPALGLVGSTCERKVSDLLGHLQAVGLGELILTGEVRVPMDRLPGGGLDYSDACRELQARGRRVGLDVTGTIVHGPQPVWVARLKDPRQLEARVNRRRAERAAHDGSAA